MLFKKKKRNDNNNQSVLHETELELLNKIDLEYMRAFSTKTVEGLRRYLSQGCLEKVGYMVHGFTDRYFADSKFRQTSWIVLNESDKLLTLKKQVVFDKIKFNSAISINAADNYNEQWVVRRDDKQLTVIDISEYRGIA